MSQLARRPAGPPQATVQPVAPPFGGTWQTNLSPATNGLCNPLLLTDGTVLVYECGTSTWFKLTPDNTGSYVNGTWSPATGAGSVAALPSGYQPQYFASAVLPDGRVIIEGGEYNSGVEALVSLGAIYDPIANSWTSVSPPTGTGWIRTGTIQSGNGGIGDAAGIVLPNGTFMLSACCALPAIDALFNATTLGWTSTGAPTDTCIPCGGGTYQDEQGYVLMQTGKVLTIDVWNPQQRPAVRPWNGPVDQRRRYACVAHRSHDLR